MEVHQIVLAYLEVLLSWPPLVGLLGTVVLVLFKKEVRSLIGRIARIRFPGGGEIALPRQAPPTDTKDAPEVPEGDVELPPNVSGAEADRLREAIRSERAATYPWEYRYLNRYLVRATQLVLDHIASSAGPIALRLLDSYLHAYEPPRVCRRLQLLRGWGHEENRAVLPRGSGAGSAVGFRAHA